MTFAVHPYNNLRKKFPPTFLTENGFSVLNRFLTYDPTRRISAWEALDHKYFQVGNLTSRQGVLFHKIRKEAVDLFGVKFYSYESQFVFPSLQEPPMAVPPSMFPTWPAKSEMSRAHKREKSPKPPEGGANTFLVSQSTQLLVCQFFLLPPPCCREKMKSQQPPLI